MLTPQSTFDACFRSYGKNMPFVFCKSTATYMQHIRGFFRPTGVYDAERLHGLTMILHHTCTLKRFKRATIDENRVATFTS